MMVDTTELVGVAEIADFWCSTAACISQWRKKYNDFPKPVAELRCGPVFVRSEVMNWMREVHAVRNFGNNTQREKWRRV